MTADDFDGPFDFKEGKVKALCELAKAGEVDQREWRDTGSSVGLFLVVGKRGGTYYFSKRVNGVKKRVRIGTVDTMQLKTARKQATAIAAGQDAGARPVRAPKGSMTADAAFTHYLDAAQKGTFGMGRRPIKESTAKSYRELWEPHISPNYGKRPLLHLGANIMQIHARFNNRPGAQKRLVQVLKNVFEHAVRNNWWTGQNPVIDPATGKAIACRGTESRERFLTDTELRTCIEFIENEGDPWDDYFRLLLLTGIRKSTVCSMAWADVDISGRNPLWRLAAEKLKNNKPLVVPLLPASVKILKRRQKYRKRKCRWVFPTDRQSKSGHIEEPGHCWDRMLEETGLDDDLRIHDLRRTAGTLAVKQHSLPEVARFLGQRTLAAVAVYARASEEGARQVGGTVAAALEEAEE